MSKTEQLELFPIQPYEKTTEERRREKSWFYVHLIRKDQMLCIDDAGNWEWRAHDTIHDTPHLFSSHKMAISAARRLNVYARAKKYQWKVDNVQKK